MFSVLSHFLTLPSSYPHQCPCCPPTHSHITTHNLGPTTHIFSPSFLNFQLYPSPTISLKLTKSTHIP